MELEQSRILLEKCGLRIAAVSYDSQATLVAFAQKHAIQFPLLSDKNSETIRRFGIFNFNMAPELRSYGVPHPVEYLVSPDRTVVRKYFVPNYQHRVTGSAVALREFGAVDDGSPAVTLESGALAVRIGFPSAKAFAGQEVAFFVRFALQPGWHIYGSSVSHPYTGTSITFEGAEVVSQRFELPAPEILNLPSLGETLPVHNGSFQGIGAVLLKHPLPEEKLVLRGKLNFQQCSDLVCEAPQTLSFELPLTLERFVVSERDLARSSPPPVAPGTAR